MILPRVSVTPSSFTVVPLTLDGDVLPEFILDINTRNEIAIPKYRQVASLRPVFVFSQRRRPNQPEFPPSGVLAVVDFRLNVNTYEVRQPVPIQYATRLEVSVEQGLRISPGLSLEGTWTMSVWHALVEASALQRIPVPTRLSVFQSLQFTQVAQTSWDVVEAQVTTNQQGELTRRRPWSTSDSVINPADI